MLGWLVYDHGIEPHVTVFDKSTRQDGTFSRDDFTYDHVGDVYSCPAGKMLTTTGSIARRANEDVLNWILAVAEERQLDLQASIRARRSELAERQFYTGNQRT